MFCANVPSFASSLSIPIKPQHRQPCVAALSGFRGPFISSLLPKATCKPSSFCGASVRVAPAVSSPHERNRTKMVVDPWSVSPAAIDALAAQCFAISLIPYLAFLYFLNRSEVACPPLVNFGFRFLLVFVFATIPAGIYAKVHYHDILANIDWLHGSAESLLTITNLLIVLGFRQKPTSTLEEITNLEGQKPTKLAIQVLPTLVLALQVASLTLVPMHQEPLNALSFPTWIIHVSSLIEWLAAMGLVWQYADSSRNPKWKGLTWGMLPLHTSGICACTYHFFYNAPSLSILVLIQACLTVLGNSTMALATYRISRAGSNVPDVASDSLRSQNSSSLPGFEDLASLPDTNLVFIVKLFVLSAVGSALVKWGSLYFDAPFNAPLALALGIIFVPTGLNVLKWASRK